MTRLALLSLLLAPLAVAAPVPKDAEREKIEKLYGKIVDPKGDCQFKMDGDKLLVTLPANETRDLCSAYDTAPKLVREVSGDFALTVRYTLEFPAEAKAGRGEATAFLGGGVQFRKGKDNPWLRFGFAQLAGRGQVESFWPLEAVPSKPCSSGIEWGHHSGAVKGNSIAFRYTRKGTKLAVELSDDGKKWHDSWNWRALPEGDLTVSLFAHHSSDMARTVAFSEFTVTPLKPEEKK